MTGSREGAPALTVLTVMVTGAEMGMSASHMAAVLGAPRLMGWPGGPVCRETRSVRDPAGRGDLQQRQWSCQGLEVRENLGLVTSPGLPSPKQFRSFGRQELPELRPAGRLRQ